MRFSKRSFGSTALALIAFLAVATDGRAQECFICDDLVTLNDRGTECFLTSYDSSIATARTQGSATIDLAPCTGATTDETRGAIDRPLGPIGRAQPIPEAPQLRSSYVLDLAGVECLRRLVDLEPRPLGEAKTFDLSKLCQHQ